MKRAALVLLLSTAGCDQTFDYELAMSDEHASTSTCERDPLVAWWGLLADATEVGASISLHDDLDHGEYYDGRIRLPRWVEPTNRHGIALLAHELLHARQDDADGQGWMSDNEPESEVQAYREQLRMLTSFGLYTDDRRRWIASRASALSAEYGAFSVSEGVAMLEFDLMSPCVEVVR